MADGLSLPAAFWEVQADLPRQGVGSDETTLQALAMCTELPIAPDALDVGCGPGAQTLALARATSGLVTAVDLHEEYLERLRERAESAGLLERIRVMRADMRDLPFEPASFDLVWSEGAAYIMGVSEALAAWRRLLRPGGYLGFSEIVWTGAARPTAVVDLLADYPGMTDVDGNLARLEDADYEVTGHFRLPESAWWDEYYDPLEARLPGVAQRHADDEATLAVVADTQREIDTRRSHADAYAYDFFIARLRPGPA